jgi:hypothetical protein
MTTTMTAEELGERLRAVGEELAQHRFASPAEARLRTEEAALRVAYIAALEREGEEVEVAAAVEREVQARAAAERRRRIAEAVEARLAGG